MTGVEELVDTPLHEAVRYSDLDDVSQALNDGCNPNELGVYQWSPLHEACNNGDQVIVKLLLKFQGDPNVPDTLRGCTAVHYAASQEHSDCLRLLLAAGALYDIRNDDGQSALDVSVGECRKLLQAERDKNIVYHPPAPEVIRQNVLDDTLASFSSGSCPSPGSELANSSCASGSNDVTRVDSGLGDQDSLLDLDEISVDSGTTTPSRPVSRVWGPDGVVHLDRNQVLGHIQLSFEYNAKKSTLKIRVWKVLDLLMPPIETSMIHSIYVKSYLFPDKRKQTKRKTEEIKLENKTDVENKKSIKSGNAIFKPSSFTFSKSLDYKDISSVMATRDVFLSVCVTQKYTHRSFTIATWSLPLKNAIKKMVKEKYTLAPCISSSIPDNMKVYNATELDIVRKKAFGSNPSLVCRRTAIGNWAVPYEGRSASDSDLNRVRVDKGVEKVPSIEITVPEVEDEELQDALEQISIMERREAAAECRSLSTTVDLDMSLDSSRISLPGVSDCDGEESYLEEVRVEPNVHLAQVEVHLPNLQKSRADDPQHSKSCRNVSPGSHWVAKSMNAGWVETIVTPPPPAVHGSDQFSSSPPATPSWDYYSESLKLDTNPVSFETEDNSFASPSLPMAMTLDLPGVHDSFKNSQHRKNDVTKVDLPELSSPLDYHDQYM